jgi:hypothetical protein
VLAYIIALMLEAASTTETSVNYQTTRFNIPEDNHIELDHLPLPIYILLL